MSEVSEAYDRYGSQRKRLQSATFGYDAFQAVDGNFMRRADLKGLHLRILSEDEVINQTKRAIQERDQLLEREVDEWLEEALQLRGKEQIEMIKALGYGPIEVVNGQIVNDILYSSTTGEYLIRNPESGQYLPADQTNVIQGISDQESSDNAQCTLTEDEFGVTESIIPQSRRRINPLPNKTKRYEETEMGLASRRKGRLAHTRNNFFH